MRLTMLVGVAWLLLVVPSSADATAAQCLTDTGYVFEDTGTALRANGGIVRPFPAFPDNFSCAPPIQGLVVLDGALLGYQLGFGIDLRTGAIAAPDDSGLSQAVAKFTQTWAFTVIPDDPQSTAPIPITLTSRHRFGTVATSVTELGSASNAHVARFTLRRSGGAIVPGWDSEDLIMSDQGMFDVIQLADAPPNVRLLWLAFLEHTSSAQGNPGSGGSGSAQASAIVTFEVTTEAAATIAFEVEETLGFAAPMLDVVLVPEPSPALLRWVAFAGIGLLRLGRSHARRPRASREREPEL